jgi:hypothetical protein
MNQTCPAAGAHLPPPDLPMALPPAMDSHNMTKALSASWHGCPACLAEHAVKAGASPQLTHEALTLWLMFMAITAHGNGTPPPANAEALLNSMLAIAQPRVSTPARTLLSGLTLTSVTAPDGHPAAMWDSEDALSRLEAMPQADRALAWQDALAFLTGVLRGYARLRGEGGLA